MADWPDTDDLKKLLDVESEDFDDHLEGLMAAGIAFVKGDVGRWDDDTDEPDEALHHAALRAAILMRPNTSAGASPAFKPHLDVRMDPAYQSLMQGHRRRFAIG